jgi:Ca2+/Na+ antiporter
MLFFTTSSILLWYGARVKSLIISSGIFALMIMVTGMGLLANLGVKHSEPWPLWVKLKFLFWALVSCLAHIIVKRFPKYGKIGYILFMCIYVLAVFTVIYKWG